jgi:hypothetical protein
MDNGLSMQSAAFIGWYRANRRPGSAQLELFR